MQFSLNTKLVTNFFGALLIGASMSTFAVTVDFQDLSTGNCGYQGNQGVTSQGFDFQGNPNDPNLWVCNPGIIANNTTQALIDANTTSFYTMTKNGGGSFVIDSFYAGARFGQQPTGIDVVGNLAAGGQISQQFLFDNFVFEQFTLSAAFNQALNSVSFASFGGSSSEFVLDDIVVDVPAPAGVMFIIAGLGLLLRRSSNH